MATRRITERIRVLQITDTHLSGENDPFVWGLDTLESMRRVVARALRDQGIPDLVVATGDLAHEPTPLAYQRLCETLSAIPAPVACLPGNHDAPELLAKTLHGTHLSYMRDWKKGEWNVLLVDSTVPGKVGGHIDGLLLDDLDRRLRTEPERHALLCLHHPPVSVGSSWMDRSGLDNAEELLAIVDRHPQVQGIVWGHIHQEFSAERNGVRLLGAPSTCVQFAPGSEEHARDDGRTPGYRWVHLYPDGHLETGVGRIDEYPCVRTAQDGHPEEACR